MPRGAEELQRATQRQRTKMWGMHELLRGTPGPAAAGHSQAEAAVSVANAGLHTFSSDLIAEPCRGLQHVMRHVQSSATQLADSIRQLEQLQRDLEVILAEAQDVRGALEGMSDSSPAILDDIKQKLRASLPD